MDVRAKGVTDKCFDPPESLRGPERLARNAVQQAFKAAFRPVVEFACKARGTVVYEYDIVRAFVAGGRKLPAKNFRRLIPVWN